MVKSISVALGEPNLYTNALVNKYLPFVVEWDDMSEESKTEMIESWSPAAVGRRAFADKTGMFAAEYDDVRTEWCSKGGTECYKRRHGLWDAVYDDVRQDWRIKGGIECYNRGHGAFDTTDERLVEGGFRNWGDHSHANETGAFDTTNPAYREWKVKGGENCSKTEGSLIDRMVKNGVVSLQRVIDFVKKVSVYIITFYIV